jgi:hypothetical protein
VHECSRRLMPPSMYCFNSFACEPRFVSKPTEITTNSVIWRTREPRMQLRSADDVSSRGLNLCEDRLASQFLSSSSPTFLAWMLLSNVFSSLPTTETVLGIFDHGIVQTSQDVVLSSSFLNMLMDLPLGHVSRVGLFPYRWRRQQQQQQQQQRNF